MTGPEKVEEIEKFLEELEQYRYLRVLDNRGELKKSTRAEIAPLRDKLLGDVGRFRELITQLIGKEKIHVLGKGPEYDYDMWSAALKRTFDKRSLNALDICIDTTKQAIGKLEDDIKNGIRDKKTGLLKPVTTVELPPKAFISHGKASAALNKLKEFLETLGIEPLIVKKQPSLDKDLPDKVDLYLSQADFVIILATADDKVEDKLQPRQNVIHEIGLSQKTHPGKIIYLLEEGAEFPSNIRPKVWESFKQRNMMNAFLGIVRELRAYGMLKVTKYPIEEQT